MGKMPDWYFLPSFLNADQDVRDILAAAYGRAEESRCGVTGIHILWAITDKRLGWFTRVTVKVGGNPKEIREHAEVFLKDYKPKNRVTSWWSKDKSVEIDLGILIQLAQIYSTRHKRPGIALQDLFMITLKEDGGMLNAFLSSHGVNFPYFLSLYPSFFEDIVNKRYDIPDFLSGFADNMNKLAWQGNVHPVYGRDEEIRKTIEILNHKDRPSSVIITGEPGVGKTAIVEGLAWRIEFEPDKVPASLVNCQILNCRINDIVAGTSLRGQFEENMRKLIEGLKLNPHLILFVDEIHTIVGSGSAIGVAADGADILKSVLSRGEIRIIGATTPGEYKRYIKEDPAFARRFEEVYASEPSIPEARLIIANIRKRLEATYTVKITDEAIDTAIELSPRYMRHLRLPDKTIGWIHTAASRAEIDGRREVGAEDIIDVISDKTRMPKDLIKRDVLDKFKDLEFSIGKRLVGQPHAVKAVKERIILNKGHLKDNFFRPDGVFLFLGPTGVGKTEFAKALAEFLFNDESKMTRLDMSEYGQGPASVSKLMGMSRGYTGSEMGGILTGKLRENPYTVLLLDEIEKASPDVHNLLLQAFSDGWITDGQGERSYLSDAITIMTSNIGSQYFKKLTNPLGFGTKSEERLTEAIYVDIKRELERTFSPEFINRIDAVVIFYPLTKEEIKKIAGIELEKISSRAKQNGKTVVFDESVYEAIIDKGYSLTYGARFLHRTIEDLVSIPLSLGWNEADSFFVFGRQGDIAIKEDNTQALR